MNSDQLKALAFDKPFRPFVLEMIGGSRIGVLSAGAISIPPGEEPSYVLVYFMVGKISIPRFIDLDAIDHIDFEQ
jgi:hypothetical protein